MSRFDEELREALKRVEPPEGFTGRVLARVAKERGKTTWLERFRRSLPAPGMRWMAVAAVMLAIVAGLEYQREADRRARGEQAKEQVMLALKITAQQIQIAERSVQRWNSSQ